MNKTPIKKTKKVDLTKPIMSIENIGTDADCWGTFDLTDEACSEHCGASSVCQILTAQNQKMLRVKMENKTPYRDVLEAFIDKESLPLIKKFIGIKRKKGYSDDKVIRLTYKKFQVPKKYLRELL